MNKVQVVVVRCSKDNNTAFGDWIRDERYDDVATATEKALGYMQKGVCVIVRPMYNELDHNGRTYFREWRSFNGNPLREVCFGVGF